MRKLDVFYLSLFIGLLFCFHILYSIYNIHFAYINIVFLVSAAWMHKHSKLFLYITSVLSWFVLYPVFIFLYNTDLINALVPLLIFNGFLMGIIIYKEMIAQASVVFDSELRMEEGNKKAREAEFKKLSDLENEIREKELTTVNLYEITKKMSCSLKFEDIFNVLSSFLKDNFIFRRCELVVLKWDGVLPRPERYYSVWLNKKTGDYDFRMNYYKLLEVLLKNPKLTDFTREADTQLFKDLGVENEEVSELIAVPLFGGKKIAAVLIVENLEKSDFEKFVILATQFALEIRKVLLYETVEELAITDGLTGLFVRRYFMERLTEELYRSKRYKFKFAYLMIDIDDFKKCNDTYGHLVGDVILKETARLMKECVREIDLVARFGGEEFAIVLPETSEEGARLVAERIRKRIAENVFKAYDEKLQTTVSIGISVYPEDSKEASGVIEKADAALYVAKKSGKNIVCEYKK